MIKNYIQFNEQISTEKQEKAAIAIIKKFQLDDYFGVVVRDSKSNSAPYHNLYHVLCMIKNSYYISKDEGLEDKEIRKILIACLFHDFNHSMGEKTDKENVLEAINSFKKYSIETEEVNNEIINMIKATEYPYVIDEKDLSIKDKIIRDADLLQWSEDNHLQQIVFGLLSKELKGDLKKNIENQIKFIKMAKIYTNYAKLKFEAHKERCLDEYEYIKNLIEK